MLRLSLAQGAQLPQPRSRPLNPPQTLPMSPPMEEIQAAIQVLRPSFKSLAKRAGTGNLCLLGRLWRRRLSTEACYRWRTAHWTALLSSWFLFHIMLEGTQADSLTPCQLSNNGVCFYHLGPSAAGSFTQLPATLNWHPPCEGVNCSLSGYRA